MGHARCGAHLGEIPHCTLNGCSACISHMRQASEAESCTTYLAAASGKVASYERLTMLQTFDK